MNTPASHPRLARPLHKSIECRAGKGTLKGFTLVEVMIVVVIMAVLAAIALPSYRDSVAKSRRSEARALLTEASQYMQRFYGQHDRYDQTNAATPVAVALPDDLLRVPRGAAAGTQTYTLSFVSSSLTPNAYVLQAVPRSAGPMASDRCGSYTLDNVGRRGLSGAATGVTVRDCW